MRDIVIIGTGQAGLSCALGLRKAGYDGRLTLVGDEPGLPYQRPPLSKAYLLGNSDPAQLELTSQKVLDDQSIALVSGRKADVIDADARKVSLDDGARLDFDKLVLATGSRARRLAPEQGMDLKGVFTLRSVADADALRARLDDVASAVIIGGGYIGLEVAASLASRGIAVTVLEAAPRILARVTGTDIAAAIERRHRAAGVDILAGVALDRLEGDDGRFTGVRLADGRLIAGDIALIGIGGLANDGLAAAAGIATRNGIIVDEWCRSAHPDVFAAGDCAVFPFRGELVRLESVQNAGDQADHVAQAILGAEHHYDPVPWFWSDQFDIKLQTAGLSAGHDHAIVKPGAREGAQAVWYLSQGRAIAVDTINDPRTHLSAKRLFAAGHGIGEADLADPDFDAARLAKSLAGPR